MKAYVALLRGINVGGNKKVSMSALKHTFKQAGFTNVRTYINSGNVIFESLEKINVLKNDIEATLLETFGFEIKVVIRSKEQIAHLCALIPKSYQNNAEQKTDILFLWDECDKKETLDLIQKTNVDTLTYVGGAIIWHVKRGSYEKSGMHNFIGTPVYKYMTARNVNTVRKLAGLMGVLK